MSADYSNESMNRIFERLGELGGQISSFITLQATLQAGHETLSSRVRQLEDQHNKTKFVFAGLAIIFVAFVGAGAKWVIERTSNDQRNQVPIRTPSVSIQQDFVSPAGSH